MTSGLNPSHSPSANPQQGSGQEQAITKPEALRVTDSPFKPRYGNFIDGRWIEAASGRRFVSTSPVNGRRAIEVARSDAADVEWALDAAHRAREAWARTSVAFRTRCSTRSRSAWKIISSSWLAPKRWKRQTDTRDNRRGSASRDRSFPLFAGCIRAQEGGISEVDPDTVAYHFHEPLGVVGQIIRGISRC